MMRSRPAVLAVVFDFDDTLVPDSTTKLLQTRGVDPAEFWTKDVRRRLKQGFDPTLAYLGLILEYVGLDRPLGCLSNQDLREFGATLDSDFFPGLPELFDDLRAVGSVYNDVAVEFHIISGGLLEVVRGSKTVQKHFTGVYGCEFSEAPATGYLSGIKRAITFTEKTRYLFEINKGIEPADVLKNPYVVNRDIAVSERPVPFENMIYVGDGLTDIPCFSLLKKERGAAFGVFDPGRPDSARRAFTEFLRTDRVISMHAPKYGQDDELGSLLRTAVATRASAITIQRAGGIVVLTRIDHSCSSPARSANGMRGIHNTLWEGRGRLQSAKASPLRKPNHQRPRRRSRLRAPAHERARHRLGAGLRDRLQDRRDRALRDAQEAHRPHRPLSHGYQSGASDHRGPLAKNGPSTYVGVSGRPGSGFFELGKELGALGTVTLRASSGRPSTKPSMPRGAARCPGSELDAVRHME